MPIECIGILEIDSIDTIGRHHLKQGQLLAYQLLIVQRCIHALFFEKECQPKPYARIDFIELWTVSKANCNKPHYAAPTAFNFLCIMKQSRWVKHFRIYVLPDHHTVSKAATTTYLNPPSLHGHSSAISDQWGEDISVGTAWMNNHRHRWLLHRRDSNRKWNWTVGRRRGLRRQGIFYWSFIELHWVHCSIESIFSKIRCERCLPSHDFYPSIISSVMKFC